MRQAHEVIDTYRDHQHRQATRDITLAWHTGRFGRVKKLKPLKAYLAKLRRGPLPQPDAARVEQIREAAERWQDQINEQTRGEARP